MEANLIELFTVLGLNPYNSISHIVVRICKRTDPSFTSSYKMAFKYAISVTNSIALTLVLLTTPSRVVANLSQMVAALPS